MGAFLDRRISFSGIPAVVGETLSAHSVAEPQNLEGVARADAWARSYARELVADQAVAAVN